MRVARGGRAWISLALRLLTRLLLELELSEDIVLARTLRFLVELTGSRDLALSWDPKFSLEFDRLLLILLLFIFSLDIDTDFGGSMLSFRKLGSAELKLGGAELGQKFPRLDIVLDLVLRFLVAVTFSLELKTFPLILSAELYL